jgi:molecular chaperone DnaK
VPQIEVTFDIDADGIVNVSAKDKATNKDQSITIAASSGLSDAEIQNMVNDAERFAESDKKRKEVIEATNHAQSMIHETEKAMADFKDQLDKAEAESLQKQMTELREMIAQDPDTLTAESIKEKSAELQQGSLKLFQKVYEKKAADKDSGEAKKDEPIDAEFKDAPKKE